ncbi:P-loop containing nucleoside triphosphate hydrolase protein [Mycena pura]|uniref:P-loop containing nucleoside triphosphate hydrolase protein n=1 Tax=Mycena pura TaxID=153505 RepID=A0AAD6VHF6_9AGAR|nr:P-loop containing nucleoside triphosphate hydrolase protein [Mycena pura]
MSALKPLLAHVLHATSASATRPLFLALQGPQGSGKSYLSALLVEELRSHSMKVALISLDDIYLPHVGLVALAEAHPENALWRGRGQPGTHDVPMGLRVLAELQEGSAPVELPRFDKSLFGGEGDRVPAGAPGAVVAAPPMDVVLLEGWCVGFYPVTSAELDARWNGAWAEECQRLELRDAVRREDVRAVNEVLKNYIPMWELFDVFVQLQPSPPASGQSPLSVVYKWRLEQEHHMKAHNGGRGMDDAGVKAFVDRYIPGYVFFGDGPTKGFGEQKPRWLGKSLRICVDEERAVVATENF